MVDTKELMIGDYVRVVSKGLKQMPIVKVTAVYDRGISTHINGKHKVLLYDELEPIVFNYGLAVNNGFKTTDNFTWTHKDKDGMVDFEFTVYPDDYGKSSIYYLSVAIWGFKKASIKYVHEFQHALRICGLMDMADNLIKMNE